MKTSNSKESEVKTMAPEDDKALSEILKALRENPADETLLLRLAAQAFMMGLKTAYLANVSAKLTEQMPKIQPI